MFKNPPVTRSVSQSLCDSWFSCVDLEAEGCGRRVAYVVVFHMIWLGIFLIILDLWLSQSYLLLIAKY